MNELHITPEQEKYFEKLGVITADELRIAFRKSCEDLEKIGLEADRVRAEQAEEGEKIMDKLEEKQIKLRKELEVIDKILEQKNWITYFETIKNNNNNLETMDALVEFIEGYSDRDFFQEELIPYLKSHCLERMQELQKGQK